MPFLVHLIFELFFLVVEFFFLIVDLFRVEDLIVDIFVALLMRVHTLGAAPAPAPLAYRPARAARAHRAPRNPARAPRVTRA